MSNVTSIELKPLCVDLDGTLARTDFFLESVVALLKSNILYCFVLPFWLLKGKAYVKQELANRINIDVSKTPYQTDFLAYLNDQKKLGRMLVLATGSNKKFADAVQNHLQIFDLVIASDKTCNLTGTEKRKKLVDLYGQKGFDYAGNSKADLDVWSYADKIVLVNPDFGILSKATSLAHSPVVFDDREHWVIPFIKALRLYQWLKNILVFVPLMLAYLITNTGLVIQSILAFIAFSFCTSSVYILNDLMDVSADRQHQSKAFRPIASGALPISKAAWLLLLMLVLSIFVAQYLPAEFQLALAVYYAITLLYSYRLKRVVIVDVLTLASLYTLRIIAGAMAISINPSFWLLSFSMFLFFSLALMKRYSELFSLGQRGEKPTTARGYLNEDLDSLAQFGISSGFMSVMVLALYIDSSTVSEYYLMPEFVWFLCPLLLYWISRIWLLTRRGLVDEDPIVFAMKDSHSYVIGLVGMIILWLSI